MKSKEVTRIKALLQAMKNKVGMKRLRKNEELQLFSKVNNLYLVRMIKQVKK
tara:strand:- start:603 stop:758 length:156 start_codon:yes stop_codon:yes gene_type:complete